MNGCFTCLNCGRVNPIKGHSFTNKYCNNKCQADHRSRSLVQDWKQTPVGTKAWPKVPDWIKKYLIEQRGHRCEQCHGTQHNRQEIPLVVDYQDGNSYNNAEDNLKLICPNCRALKK
jgi:nitrate reductase cytochrome c-type subunit